MFFICGCLPDLSYEREADCIAWEYESAPLSLKENKFQDSLTHLGFPTMLDRKFIGRLGVGQSSYNLKVNCEKVIVTTNNIDSLERFRREILKKLYSDIIDDSVIYDINTISVVFNNINYEKGLDHDKFFFGKNYFKDFIENLNGFKVIKIGEDKYKRVPLSE